MDVPPLLSNFEAHLKLAGKENCLEKGDIEQVYCFVLNITRSKLYLNKDLGLNSNNISIINTYIQRRIKGEPLAYILGNKGFWNLDLMVNSAVLIPRPETETLVYLILKSLNEHMELKLIDLGTGSGAIALSLASARKNWEIYGLDKSIEALKVAKINAKTLNLKIKLILGNWTSSIAEGVFDVVVANPPYIDSFDAALGGDGVRFEPKEALVASENGYNDIKEIITSSNLLKKGGSLYLEHSPRQTRLVKKTLRNSGFETILTHEDLNGDQRVTTAKKINER